MIISLITVTYNCDNYIKKTLSSVKNQSYKNIEHIIIDGGSKDGTQEIISEYVSQNNYSKYISEPDKGIYDAMNKGINLSKGEYIFFLNAGDVFYENSTLENIIKCVDDEDIIYGNINMSMKGDNKKLKSYEKFKLDDVFYGKMICHQAIFASRRMFKKENNFVCKYKLAADFEWFIRNSNGNIKLKYVNIIVSNYDTTGFSSIKANANQMLNEYIEILDKYSTLRRKYLFILKNIKPLIINQFKEW